jgi:hypothetical protein
MEEVARIEIHSVWEEALEEAAGEEALIKMTFSEEALEEACK